MKRYTVFKIEDDKDVDYSGKFGVGDLYTLETIFMKEEELIDKIKNEGNFENATVIDNTLFTSINYVSIKYGAVLFKYGNYILAMNKYGVNIINFEKSVIKDYDLHKIDSMRENVNINKAVDVINNKIKLLGCSNSIVFPVDENRVIYYIEIKKHYSNSDKIMTINIPKLANVLYIQGDSVNNVKLKINKAENIETIYVDGVYGVNIENGLSNFKSLKCIGNLASLNCEELVLKGIDTIAELGLAAGYFKKVYIEDGPIRLGERVFIVCKYLKEVRLPKGLEKIPKACFEDCENLEIINIPNTVRIIEAEAFMNCRSLQNIVLPEGLEELRGYSTFKDCEKLEYIKIPNSIKCIDKSVFCHSNIKKISMPKEFYNKNIEKIEIPNGCKMELY